MPNWIINRLLVKGGPERIRNFLQLIKSERQPFDFERVIPSPEIIRRARRMFSPGEKPQEQYFIDAFHSRAFTPVEEKELEAVGYRSWDDWSFANWGTNKIAFEVEVDESSIDLGYVVISFETAWSPPVRILERLQEMFSELAFCCEWFAEDEFFYRCHPGQPAAIARREREQFGEQSIATLYLTNVDNPEFFLETRIVAESRGSSKTEPMNRGEAHEWILAPDVKLLALLCPELPTAQSEAVGAREALTQTSDKPIAEPDDQNCPDDIPL
jgi:hypothetical protein